MLFWALQILAFLGSIGLLIFGMKVMSAAIQKIAGRDIQSTLDNLTASPFRGVFTGFFITAATQSSSATTVLTVSFVNAGLLSLVGSVGIIMGANIGTTITAWLISILGFEINISSLTLPIIAIGIPFLFSKRNQLNSWGEFLIGIALLFMGLSELRTAVPDFTKNPEILSFLSNYTDYGFLSILLFVAIGAILTMLIQSSSVMMVITIVLADQGWLSLEMAAAMVLGANIGTTVTVNIAAVVGNVMARRAALSHFLINALGVAWATIFLGLLIKGINTTMLKVYGPEFSSNSSLGLPVALSIFHTVFNFLNVALLIGFIPSLIKLTEKIIPSRKDEVFKLEHIGTSIVETPEIQVIEAKKEIIKTTILLDKMYSCLNELVADPVSKHRNQLMTQIRKNEINLDRIREEIEVFLGKVSEKNITGDSSKRILTMLVVMNHLNKIGDLYYKVALVLQRAKDLSIKLSDNQLLGLKELKYLIGDAQRLMKKNLISENGSFDYKAALQKEREIDAKRNEIRREHLTTVDGEYSIQSGMYYNELFNTYEEVGDHLFNISKALSENRQ